MKKLISMLIALVLLCAIPLSGMAAGTAHGLCRISRRMN